MWRVKAGLEHKQQPVKPEKRGPLDIPDTERRCGKGEEENPFNEQTAAAHCKVFPFLFFFFYPPFSFFSPSRPESQRAGRHFQVLFLLQPTGKGPTARLWSSAIMLPGTLILRERTWLQWKKWSMDTLFLHPCHQCEHMRAHQRMLTTAATKKLDQAHSARIIPCTSHAGISVVAQLWLAMMNQVTTICINTFLFALFYTLLPEKFTDARGSITLQMLPCKNKK